MFFSAERARNIHECILSHTVNNINPLNTCQCFVVILIPKVELILEQGWMKGLYTYGECKTEYGKSDDSSRDTRPWSENLFFGFVLAFLARGYSGLAEFLLENFREEYSVHAEIAKELKKKNEKIYSKVMVGMV